MLKRVLRLFGGRRPPVPASRRSFPTAMRLALEALESRDCPAPLVWSSGVSLPAAASGLSATLDSDQSILLFGNGSTSVHQLAPGAGSWTSVAPIDLARTAPGVALVSGSPGVIVYGGYSVSDAGATDATLGYDPTSAANGLSLDTLHTPAQNLGYTSDGTYAYAVGGTSDTGARLTTVERYDPSQDVWTTLAPLPQAISGLQAVYDGNGHIYAIGGQTASGVSANVYRYTIATNTWSTAASLPTAEASGAAVLGPYDRLYVMGGIGSNGALLSTVQSYNLNTGTWATETNLPTGLADEAAVVDSLGRIEVIGGVSSAGVSSAVYVSQQLDVKTPVFTSTPPTGANLVVGNTFTFTASATSVPQPTFSLVNPPANASIDANTGLLQFKPSIEQVGPQTIDVRASNSLGQADQLVTLNVQAPAPMGVALASETINSVTLSWNASTSAGNVASYRIYVQPSATASTTGYTLAVNNISGTSATVTGLASNTSYNFKVTSVDTAGNESAASAPLTVQTWSLPTLTLNPTVPAWYNQYTVVARHTTSFQLYATGNPAPTSYAIVSGGSAYPGLTINSTTGVLTWTNPPDSLANAGMPAVELSATSAAGTGYLYAYIFVKPNLPVLSSTYTTATGANAIVNQPFGMQLQDSSGAPVTWTLVSGPAGLTVSSTGMVSWTPTLAQANAASSAPLDIRATNYAGSTELKLSIPLGFAGPPKIVNVSTNTTANTVTVNWLPPSDISSPITGYQVTLSYTYYSRGGGGRGGGGARWVTVTYTNSASATSTSSAFAVLSSLKGRSVTATVVALDGAGGRSIPGTTGFTV